MYQVSITLPTTQHNGISNHLAIGRIQNQIALLYGGYSAMPMYGGWYDEKTGEFYRDESVLVWTFVKTTEDVQAIKELACGWANQLQQIELLVTVNDVAVTFIQGTRVQARQAA